MVRLCAIGLALAGFLPVLSFVGNAMLPAAQTAPITSLLPHSLQPGLALAVLGVAVMALGAHLARRQRRGATRKRWEEQLRRVQLSSAGGDTQWISPAADRLEETPPLREKASV